MFTGVGVMVGVLVMVLVKVADGVLVAVGVKVFTGELVGVGVFVEVGVEVTVGVSVGVLVVQELKVRIWVLEVTAGMESAAMVKLLEIGLPVQDTVPHHLMGLSKENIVAGKAPLATFQTKGAVEKVPAVEPT